MPNSGKGFIYIWTLFAVTLAGIMLAGTGQVWQVKAQREKEKELLLVGDQFRQAVMSYYNSSPAGAKQYPGSLEQLLEDKRAPVTKRHLRKIFLDPMTKTDEWGLVEEPPPEHGASIATKPNTGIIGVYSLSKNMPIKTKSFPDHYANFSEATTYQDWKFVFSQGDAGDSTQKQPQQASSSSNPKDIFSSQKQPASNTPGFSSQNPPASNKSGAQIFQ
ncbi:MAG: type II secretion system protein [Nitrosomonas sp.]|nr:type II secretion system protein [Nitrosomonas sp.]MDP1950849.1 type II secretion system protein [Nitrosomonas sp.]